LVIYKNRGDVFLDMCSELEATD